MARRSELVAMQISDLHTEPDGFTTVHIARSKVDQHGEGADAAIPADAMRHVRAWIVASGIEDGPLFRRVRAGDRIGETALDPGNVARLFKAMARRAGLSSELDVALVSGHSTRIGAAHDMLIQGQQLPAIMQAARWKTAEMVIRYTKRVSARQGAAMQVARKRVQF